MRTTVSLSNFRNAFAEYGRKDNFSYEGLTMIFDYLEQYEDDSGEELELDVIAVCCDFNEDNFLDVARNYDIDLSDCEDDDEIRETVLEYLGENTTVVGNTDDMVVYGVF